MGVSYQLSNILAIFFIINNYEFGKIDVAILVLCAPTKIIVTAVHGARATFTLDIFMTVGGLDNITTEIALNGVFNNFSHTCVNRYVAPFFG